MRNFDICYLALLDTLFTIDAIKYKSYTDFLLECLNDIISKGKEKNGIVKPMVDRLIEILKQTDTKTNENFITVLIDLLTFGDVYKKEKRNLKDIEVFIESLGESFGTNQIIKAEYLHDPGVRVCTLSYLLTEEKLDDHYFDLFIIKSFEKDAHIMRDNQKLFINSLIHRERFRLWQSILVLLQRFNNKTQFQLILDYADDVLVTETQPSNRILLEWIHIRIYLLMKIDLMDLFKITENFNFKKVGYTCSWIAILSHLAPFVNESKKIEYFKSLTSLVLSQILSANFHIRIYAEATLIKLYTMLIDTTPNGLNDEVFLNSPDICSLKSIMSSISKQTIDDKDRHSNLILTHFYFQFNPQEDLTIDTIFNAFPRLCGLIEDEWIELDTYLCLITNKKFYEHKAIESLKYPIKFQNEKSKLVTCQTGLWRFTPYKDDSSYEPAVNIEDLQKKITPWHTLIPLQQEMDLLIKQRKPNSNFYDTAPGLVLVASLIDKGPNLGGICRTCEIFNVKELVLGNLKFMDDKQFQSLAVTAQKWLNIKEVPVKFLKTFLTEMKLRGYTLIGVEQTANSVQLNKFEFPSKSLLLLGNEKEGIPVELIQLLDVCVEIPQLGIIRSLNVHVSAAITIWEYTKQYFNKLNIS